MTDQNPEPNPFEQIWGSSDPMPPLSMLQPSPANMSTGIMQTPMGKLVLFRFETVVGSIAVVSSPKRAKEYALEIAATAAKAESSLIVPPGA